MWKLKENEKKIEYVTGMEMLIGLFFNGTLRN